MFLFNLSLRRPLPSPRCRFLWLSSLPVAMAAHVMRILLLAASGQRGYSRHRRHRWYRHHPRPRPLSPHFIFIFVFIFIVVAIAMVVVDVLFVMFHQSRCYLRGFLKVSSCRNCLLEKNSRNVLNITYGCPIIPLNLGFQSLHPRSRFLHVK